MGRKGGDGIRKKGKGKRDGSTHPGFRQHPPSLICLEISLPCRAPVQAIEATDLLLNCSKYGNFNLWKIVKNVATRCQILRLKCTEFDFNRGPLQMPLGQLTTLPRSSSWILRGLLLRGREVRGAEGKG
jgi:hypothetical protein